MIKRMATYSTVGGKVFKAWESQVPSPIATPSLRTRRFLNVEKDQFCSEKAIRRCQGEKKEADLMLSDHSKSILVELSY